MEMIWLLIGLFGLQIDPVVVEELLLWEKEGMGEVNTYRIPLLTSTPNGNLLAIVEARKMNSDDAGSKFIAQRRSTDRGKSCTNKTNKHQSAAAIHSFVTL